MPPNVPLTYTKDHSEIDSRHLKNTPRGPNTTLRHPQSTPRQPQEAPRLPKRQHVAIMNLSVASLLLAPRCCSGSRGKLIRQARSGAHQRSAQTGGHIHKYTMSTRQDWEPERIPHSGATHPSLSGCSARWRISAPTSERASFGGKLLARPMDAPRWNARSD